MIVKHQRTIEITRHLLKVKTPIFVAHKAQRSGDIVEVSTSEATDLLRRGRAVSATQSEVTAASEITVSQTVLSKTDQFEFV